MTIGKRMRQRRRALDITQEQLEALAGIKQSHISAMEKDRIQIVKSDTLIRLAKALRVSTDWLLGLKEDEDVEQLAAATA